ncbi:ArsR/SmtB family transcription factor [Amycolatopsis cihanbeyliensis]|uniref:ArsR family transcriptional regulator n=1 Tax=Amycolatopsis cihanbeyliensis TaxID=1128664 RepID=A0A542DNG3_AMYCI|nr:metalloregulator ArsR/SmtB family transcription factor [Amycolatopsis cihanbeyliensis]TQJ04597.1 ArsR family transcriptional regulator [Amycolatopsis cihanbeyliensis]
MRAHEHTTTLDPDQLAVGAGVLGLLADPTRLHLLHLLAGWEQDVNTLTAQVAASRSSVSQHLSRLRLAGLVRARREGRRMYYRLASEHLAALVAEALGYADHTVRHIPHHGESEPTPARAGTANSRA